MKKFVVALLVFGFLVAGSAEVFAFKQLSDRFKKIYAGDEASEEFKELVKEAKCNVCHINKQSKKKRNPYGTALHDMMEEEEFDVAAFKKSPDDEELVEQITEIFKKLGEEESGDEDHKTFASRIEADLLPGGDVEGK